MDCNLCEKPYNLTDKLPFILSDCGHSLCSNCLKNLKNTINSSFKCPFDNLLYEKKSVFKNNLFLIQRIKEQNRNEVDSKTNCQKHSRVFEIFCVDCDEEVCSDCVLFDDHKEHKYEQMKKRKTLQNIFEKKNELRTKIENVKKIFQGSFDVISKRIEDFEQDQKKILITRFNHIKQFFVKLESDNLDKLKLITKTLFSNLEDYRIKIETLEENINCKDASLFSSQNLNLIENEVKVFEESLNDFDENYFAKNLKFEMKFDPLFEEKFITFCEIIYSIKNFAKNEKSSTTLEKDSQEEKLLLYESLQDLIKTSNESKKQNPRNFDNYIKTPHKNNPPNTNNFFFEKEFNTPLAKKLDYHQNLDSSFQKNKNARLNKTNQKSCTSLLNIKNQTITPNILKTKNFESQKDINPFNNKINTRSTSKVASRKKSFIVNSTVSLLKHNDVSCNKENDKSENNNNPTQNTKHCHFQNIFENIEKKNLVTLNLSNLDINDKLLVSISSKIKKLKTLKTIKMERNSITDIGLKYLLKNIKENQVEFIFLNENNLKETAIDYLISFRKYNQYLKAVYMEKNHININESIVKTKIELLESKKLMLII
jgi:hypothetical protein